ncbi:MAG TPA: endonuclease/exonuclease/phosphatase family protein [Actinomycetota bacterium]|nr:endonuclease/exonuclease/phosphatase family protein [Actinomycetota bacterium]
MPVLRVTTFNVHHCRGLDGLVNPRRIAAVLVESQGRFFGVQELDRNLERSGRIDQPAVLGELLGCEVHFSATVERGGGQYGLGVAAPDPLEPTFHRLPRLGDEEPRGAITVRWHGLSIIVTHLSLQRAPRLAQLDALAGLTAELDPPVVLMGDLNTGWLGTRRLIKAGLRQSPGWRPTVEEGFPRQIDHVLTGRGAAAAGLRTLSGGASDHKALAAEIIL